MHPLLLAVSWMQLFVLLEPKELAIDPLCSLVVPQLVLLLFVKLDVVEFDLVLERWVVLKHKPVFPQVSDVTDIDQVLHKLGLSELSVFSLRWDVSLKVLHVDGVFNDVSFQLLTNKRFESCLFLCPLWSPAHEVVLLDPSRLVKEVVAA